MLDDQEPASFKLLGGVHIVQAGSCVRGVCVCVPHTAGAAGVSTVLNLSPPVVVGDLGQALLLTCTHRAHKVCRQLFWSCCHRRHQSCQPGQLLLTCGTSQPADGCCMCAVGLPQIFVKCLCTTHWPAYLWLLDVCCQPDSVG